jgi:hypothetical protein
MSFFDNKITGLFNKGVTTETELADINCLNFGDDFCNVFALSMYKKIMLECADRAVLPNSIDKADYTATVYDSYSPYKSGLVSWVTVALVGQKKIFLKINKLSSGIFTFEKSDESAALNNGKLRADFMELDFTNFKEASVICLLFELLAQVMLAMSKGVTASQGLLLKINALSEMIANAQNLAPLEKQLKSINDGLRQGKASYVDAKSSVDFLVYDSANAEKAASYIFSLISTITGLPASYLFGEVVSSLGGGDSGDSERFDKSTKNYFYNIWSGVCFNVYGENFEFRESPADINELISLFTFIETTTALTDAGKLKFMINNTAFDAEDFTYGKGGTTTAVTPIVEVVE